MNEMNEMNKKEMLQARLKHLEDGRKMLDFVTPLIREEKERKEVEEKKVLLDMWISELTS